jgi:tRNA wybutosine-synthesizing protein 1
MSIHREIREFAAQLAAETTYDTIDESEESRVVLLSRLGKPKRFGGG